MICRKCGEILKDTAQVCHICGATLYKDNALNPTHRESKDCAHDGSKRRPKKRARRKNGWLGFIIAILIPIIPTLIDAFGDYDWVLGLIVVIAAILIVVAQVAVLRRVIRDVVQRHRYSKKERAYYDMQNMR